VRVGGSDARPLRMYEGAGHEGSVLDRRFAEDVLDFVRQRPMSQRARSVDQPMIADQPGAATDPLATQPSHVGSRRG